MGGDCEGDYGGWVGVWLAGRGGGGERMADCGGAYGGGGAADCGGD